MDIRPIGDIFRVKPPERIPAPEKSNKIRESQDIYDQSDASGHRKERQDTIKISKAYKEAQKAYKDTE